MRVWLLAASIAPLGTVFPLEPSLAQLECVDPTGYQVEDITLYSSVNYLEDGVIVQIEVSNLFNPSVDAMARYPYRAAVLPLRADNSQVLSPSFIIPNQRYTTVKVSVVAVPKEATVESLNIIFAGFDQIVEMAADHAFKGQPLLKVLSGYVASGISDEALSVLQRGRIVDTASTDAPTLAMLGSIPSQEGQFALRVKAICR